MPSIKKQLDTLLTREMDRKNFLQYSGGIILGLIGVTGLVRVILSSSHIGSNDSSEPKATHGYGSSNYGQ